MKVCGGKSCLLGNKPLKGYAEMLVPCFPWCPAAIMRPVKISENAVSQASGTALLKGGDSGLGSPPLPDPGAVHSGHSLQQALRVSASGFPPPGAAALPLQPAASLLLTLQDLIQAPPSQRSLPSRPTG